jgi:hypothetical protein
LCVCVNDGVMELAYIVPQPGVDSKGGGKTLYAYGRS